VPNKRNPTHYLAVHRDVWAIERMELRQFLRGGGWYNSVPSWVRAASRFSLGPARRLSSLGFRCALLARAPRA